MSEQVTTAASDGATKGKPVYTVKAKTQISGYIDGIRIRKGVGETTNAALAEELKGKGYEVTAE